MSDDMSLPEEPEYPHAFTVSPPPESREERPEIHDTHSDDIPSASEEASEQVASPLPRSPEHTRPPRPQHPPVRPPVTPPLCRISGQVLNRFFLPVCGAEVSLIPQGSSRATQTVTSDSLGRFRISHVRPGRYLLRAKRRFRRSEMPLIVSPKRCRQTGIRIRLYRG